MPSAPFLTTLMEPGMVAALLDGCTVRRGFIMQTQQQEWIVRCAYRLRQRWRTIDAQSLEHVAKELLRDESLRKLDPEEAAREWLARGACALFENER
jgi:hypothetical protein